MKKVIGWLDNNLRVIFACMMGIILISYAWMSGKDIYSVTMHGGAVYLLLGPLFVFLVIVISFWLGTRLGRFAFYKWMVRAFCVGHFLFLVFAIYHYWFKTGWDAAIVTWSAQAIATGDWNSVGHEYMSIYPNNILLACIEAFAVKLGGLLGINYYLSMIIQQCAVFAVSGYILFLVLDEIYRAEFAFGGYVMYMLFVFC